MLNPGLLIHGFLSCIVTEEPKLGGRAHVCVFNIQLLDFVFFTFGERNVFKH